MGAFVSPFQVSRFNFPSAAMTVVVRSISHASCGRAGTATISRRHNCSAAACLVLGRMYTTQSPPRIRALSSCLLTLRRLRLLLGAASLEGSPGPDDPETACRDRRMLCYGCLPGGPCDPATDPVHHHFRASGRLALVTPRRSREFGLPPPPSTLPCCRPASLLRRGSRRGG